VSLTNWKEYGGRWKRLRIVPPPWRRRRNQNRLLALESGPTVKMIANTEDLRREGGQAPGPDCLRFHDIGLEELSPIMANVSRQVMGRTYIAPKSRPVKRPKDGGGFRTLAVDNIIHRALANSAEIVLGPVLAPHMSPISHSVGGRGVSSLLADLYWAARTGNYGVMVNHDVKNAFPSFPVNVAMMVFRKYIADRGVLWLVELLLRGVEGPSKHVGIPQGLAISPLALDLALSWYFDRYWPSYPDDLLAVWRYVDNLVFLTPGMHEGRQAVDRCRTLLNRIGLTLKDLPENKYLINLHQGDTTELLGFGISLVHGSIRFDITPTALDSLKSQDSLRSRLIKARTEPNPSLTSLQMVKGWISAMGPAFDTQIKHSHCP